LSLNVHLHTVVTYGLAELERLMGQSISQRRELVDKNTLESVKPNQATERGKRSNGAA